MTLVMLPHSARRRQGLPIAQLAVPGFSHRKNLSGPFKIGAPLQLRNVLFGGHG